ncbi:XRE family transcriptional regulator of biofilm formation [Cytobacillus eiseniae]|uniref:XRE family transcriptional regulator of biofilm formation n=1 Tax=Cytobacillus eiseniae TaxID=762947 RepID=A0ABS4RG49_9BACI|nr:helix-turn-helix transcriptional regulator [Cytobacillus eiseniae]MBP2241872.1 XRE family transcriptional regulator of biofilm formation [Cytobacillus eiseniae]
MIGKNVARIRKQKGYTLSEFAELANISKSYLSNIERNINKNPSLEVMQKIAKVLNVDLITLLKPGMSREEHTYIDQEWVDFFNELKALGIEKEEIQNYRMLIEFIKWQNKNVSQIEKK